MRYALKNDTNGKFCIMCVLLPFSGNQEKRGVVLYACNPRTQESAGSLLQVCGQLGLLSNFQASRAYPTRSCLKTNKQTKNKIEKRRERERIKGKSREDLKQVLLFYYLLFFIGVLCECEWVPQYEGGGQSTTFRSPFSPTMLDSGIQLRQSCLAVRTLAR